MPDDRGTLIDRLNDKAQQLEELDFVAIAALMRAAVQEIRLLRSIVAEDANNG
jgi:hypothetical protein